MIGYSPKFPLQFDDYVGAYSLNTKLKDVAKQNFINLLLTLPGERIMDIKFGVGLRQYLFEQNTADLQTNIVSNINAQKRKYMPFIALSSISFNQSELSKKSSGGQILDISISFSIPSENAKIETILIEATPGSTAAPL